MLLSTEFNPLNALFSVRLFPHKHSISAPLRDRKRKGAFLYIVSFRRSLGLCRNRAPLCGNSPGIDTESLLPKLPANGFSLFYFPFPSVPDRQISGTAAVVRDRGSLAIYQIFPFRVWKMTEKQRQKATQRYGFMRWPDLFQSDADALLSEWETMVFENFTAMSYLCATGHCEFKGGETTVFLSQKAELAAKWIAVGKYPAWNHGYTAVFM